LKSNSIVTTPPLYQKNKKTISSPNPKKNKKKKTHYGGFYHESIDLDDIPFEGWIEGLFFFTSQKSMLDHAYIYR